MAFIGLAVGALLVLLIPTFWRGFVHLIWRPYVITKALRKQGVSGPGYRFWSGSNAEMLRMEKDASGLILENHCHDISLKAAVYYRKWIAEYGETFLFWAGTEPRICMSDPEIVREVLTSKFGIFSKNDIPPAIVSLLGKGLIFVEGADWAKHRKVLSPAFAMDKLKLHTKTMAECVKEMLEMWCRQVNQEHDQRKEIDVSEHFQELTADVISLTSFGSSYREGKEVFEAQKKLQFFAASTILSLNIPGSNYIPTRRNVEKWKLDKTVRDKLTGIIQDRLDSKEFSGYGNDLLGLMLESSQNKDGLTLSMDEIIDECKTFFFAGQETTAHLLTWAMFLLSTNKDWQEKLREEVLQQCGMEIPNADMLGKLKLVNMVLLETLRLYCPVVQIGRKTNKDMTLGNLNLLKDTVVMIPILLIHRDKRLWGDDANEFNPLRFANGVLNAASQPNALLAFSLGPRSCIGQNFSMLESKIVIAMILQRFSFSLSPKYKHAPMDVLTLQPKFGLPIVLRPLHT
ncbi:Cytochrome P450 [Canna indica]|uniref:Cytochrome P450 n=1 Tax=Canna indica TaxID=4628 RepID=A0AAQ3KF28_9LILI|nr:Cytochrome P450 [Canna indica]